MRANSFLLLFAAFAGTASLAGQEQPRIVRALKFEGNRALSDDVLKIAIATSSSASPWATWMPLRWIGLGEKRYFDEFEFRRDVFRLVLLYRQSGYMSAVVDTVVRRRGRDVFVTFRIHEGEPVRLARLDILGVDLILNIEELRRALPLQVGEPFDRARFLAAADTILARLRNAGHPWAEVLKSFDSDAGVLRAEATLEALPGPRARVGAVTLQGLQDVDSVTVRRMLSVRPGEIYRQNRLYQSQRDLYGMEVFRSVEVLLADSAPPTNPADTLVRVLVRVNEGPRHRLRLGAGYGSIDCFRVLGGWSAHDFLGGARTLDITGRVSKLGVGHPTNAGFRDDVCSELKDDVQSDTLNYSLGITLAQPAFFSPRHVASLGVFGERRSEIRAFTREAVGANVAVTLDAQRLMPVTVGYGYAVGRTRAPAGVYCRVFQVCDEDDRNFLEDPRTFAAVTVSAVRDRLNSPLDPTDGSLATLSVMHSSRAVGSDTLYEFNRAEAELAHYYPLGRRVVFAWRVRGGTVLPQKVTLEGEGTRYVPPEHRLYAGGPNSVRGYGRNELGPRVYVWRFTIHPTTGDTVRETLRPEAAPTGGNTAVVLNAELRLPSPLFSNRVRLGVFVDAGQVWEPEIERIELHTLRVTPGVGIRIATPLGPVRFDAAYNDYADEPGPLFHHNVGDNSLTRAPEEHRPARPDSFWGRVVFQFSVGQAF